MKIYYIYLLKHQIHIFFLKGINQNQKQITDENIINLIIFNVDDNNKM